MKTRNRAVGVIILTAILCFRAAIAQNCTTLQLNVNTVSSRCLSTGSLVVNVTGGSGNYSYKITGPVSSAYVTSTTFYGLAAGKYSVSVKDNSSGCVTVNDNVVITGNYAEPKFDLKKTDETCRSGKNGIIQINSYSGGRSPIIYKIVAPSKAYEGRISVNGFFDQLPPGDYSVQLTDSCGAILTQKISIREYLWQIQSPEVKEKECGVAEIYIPVSDNSGNNNTARPAAFKGFMYGVVYQKDTSWYAAPIFTYPIQKKKAVQFLVKDSCGYVENMTWVSDFIPSLADDVTTTYLSCNNFSVAVTNQHRLKNATFCLYDQQNKLKGCNNTGQFTSLPSGAYRIEAKSSCYDTIIVRKFLLQKIIPSVDSVVSVSSTGCNSYKARIAGLSNFTIPQFALYDKVGNLLVNYQLSPVFSINKSGNYCVRVKDGCYDTVINVCFRLSGPVPSIGEKVKLADINCDDATLIVDSVKNLAGAAFCLYDTDRKLIGCNNNGIFTRLRYGNYVLKVTSDKNCFDTVIEKSIQLLKVPPVVDANIAATRGCSSVQLKLGGQRLVNADYCLYDGSNNLMQCNKTGIFENIPYGAWCIKIKTDPSCYDTTISRCITIKKALPAIGTILSSDMQCEEFTATVSGIANLYRPRFILKTSGGAITDSNSTGIFKNVKYGSYCVEVWNDKSCYDTIIKKCFSYARPIPVAGNPVFTEESCFRFSVDFSIKQNLFLPSFFLLNDKRDTISVNSTGIFKNLVYGSYCIGVRDGCSGLKIEKCFTNNQSYINTNVTAEPGCILNTSSLHIRYLSGKAPYTTKIYDPAQRLLASVTTNDSTIMVNNLPEISKGLLYRVVSSDSCGKSDTRNIEPVVSGVTIENTFNAYCPDAAHPGGTTDLFVSAMAKSGTSEPVIVKVNDKDTIVNYSLQQNGLFIFPALLPSTYIVRYNLISKCGLVIFDTLIVEPYTLPSLRQSVAYTCDNGGISVGATVKGGASPFLYQVIGSIPDTPSVITDLQEQPIFEINNNTDFSLIRLRGIDACGNAALSEVSILPLADISIAVYGNCFYKPAKLDADSVPHSVNTWYRLKNNREVFVQHGITLNIPYLLPSDTGLYILKSEINNGCLVRNASYYLNGDCKVDPPVSKLILQGKVTANRVVLSWIAEDEKQVIEYVVERKTTAGYNPIGVVKVKPGQRTTNEYFLEDSNPEKGTNYYRIKILDQMGAPFFSNTVNIKMLMDRYYFYPNPAADNFYIRVPDQTHQYAVVIYTSGGQRIFEKMVQHPAGGLITVSLKNAAKGLIQLSITDLNTGLSTPYKILKE
jgi:uncharacterized protein (DUF2141 family)